jgi:AcrR family transcriptional regulator
MVILDLMVYYDRVVIIGLTVDTKTMDAKPSSQRSKSTRHRRRAKATRNKLLDAARSLFAEQGFNLTSIDDITRRADVGKGTFYYHFNNQQEIVEALVKQVIGELMEVIDTRCHDILDLRSLLDALIGAHIEFFSNRWEDFVLFFQGRTDLAIEHSYEGLETPFLDYLRSVEKVLASAIHRRLPESVLRRIACAVVGFVSGYYSFATLASLDDDIDAVFTSLRGAMAASLARFIQEAVPPLENEESGNVKLS